MIKDLVFHLGDCKTGTTSIQYTLANKSWKCAESSVLYTARVNHIPLAKTLSDPNRSSGMAGRFKELNEQLLESDCEHAVVSAEDFEFVNPKDLHNAIKKHLPRFAGKIRLIAYIRPHADRLVSTFSERSKKGTFYRSMNTMHERLIKDGLLMYAPRLTKWREVFGDSYTVRPMIRDTLYKNDVVEDFFSFLLQGKEFELVGGGIENTSPSLEDLSLLRAVQRRIRKSNPALVGPQQALGWNFAPILAAHSQGNSTKPRLHKSLAKKVVEQYSEDAGDIDARFFGGTQMTTALQASVGKAVEQEQTLKLSSHFRQNDIRNIMAFGDFMQRLMEADPAFFMYAARPEEQRRVLSGNPRIKPSRK